MRASPAARRRTSIATQFFRGSGPLQGPLPRNRLSPRHKVRPAAAIHPDPTVVVAPGLPLHTRGTASLVREPYPAAGVRLAVVALAVIGRAGNRSGAAPITRSARTRSPITG